MNQPTNENQEASQSQPVLFAITGGIGSGKSEVARIIENAGYPVIKSDDTARELMNTDAELRQELISVFGKQIFQVGGSGEIDREFLAREVFAKGKESDLKKLNSLVHPRVIDKNFQTIQELADQGELQIFLESALIFETGLDEGFDYIIYVMAPEEVRFARAAERLNTTVEEIKRRAEQQAPPSEVKGLSDFVIDNKGTLTDLEKSVKSLLPIFAVLPPKPEDEESA